MTDKLLIITDLDGSLLDEHYRWEAARPEDRLAVGHRRGVQADTEGLALASDLDHESLIQRGAP